MRTLLMALRGGPAGDSEPVIVDTDSNGVVALLLDGGERLELDETELRAALERKAA